jgi:hypothetical protein
MGAKEEAIKTWTESVKNIVQILAIIIAGAWAYWTFGVQEEPSLEARARADSTITWFTPSKSENECIAQFGPSLENVGASSFEISVVRLRGWIFERQLKDGGIATYIDSEEVQAQDPFFEKEFNNGPFIQRYPPTEKFSWTYEWIVSQEPDQLILFRIDFRGTDDRGREFATHTVKWAPICGQTQKTSIEQSE